MVKRISVEPAVFLIKNFLETASCDRIMKLSLEQLEDSEVEAGDGRQSKLFQRDDMEAQDILGTVARRLRNMIRELISDQNRDDGASFLNLYPVDTEYSEVLEAIHFSEGGFRRLHNEAFHRDRVLTSLIFLHDTPRGGEITFPMLKWDADIKQYVPSNYFQNREVCQTRDEDLCGSSDTITNHSMLKMEFCCCKELLRIQPHKVCDFNNLGVARSSSNESYCREMQWFMSTWTEMETLCPQLCMHHAQCYLLRRQLAIMTSNLC